MNDSEAAFKQQFEKLQQGGELHLECCGVEMRVNFLSDVYVVLVETRVSPDRLSDFLQQIQQDTKENEHYILQNNTVYYCLFLKNGDLKSMVTHALAAVRCSMAYQ